MATKARMDSIKKTTGMVWLIAKGFNSSAIAAKSARTETKELLSAA